MGANTSFDIQLGVALRHEGRLKEVLENSTIELKTELQLWQKTGNICVEYEYNGKPSGIAATEADFWVHELTRDDETLVYLMFPVGRLKEICREAYKAGKVRAGCGDGGKSKVILLPLANLLTT